MRLLTVVLGQPEFKILVKGEKLFTHGIEIILSNIGFDTMKQIIREEEQKHFSGATTIVKKSPTNILDKNNFATNFAKRVIKNIESKKGILKSRQVGGLCEETAKELSRLNSIVETIAYATGIIYNSETGTLIEKKGEKRKEENKIMLKKNTTCKLKDTINKRWLKVLSIEFPQANDIDGAIVYLEWNKEKNDYDKIATNWSNPNFDIYINGNKILFEN